VENWEGRVDDAKVESHELVAAALDKGLDSVYVFGVLIDSWIVGEEKEFCVGDSA
jgi:hypothetical protein